MQGNDGRDVVKAIERARREQGSPIAELARRIGVDRKRLWRVLNMERRMRIEEFLALCVALRIDPRAFITRELVREVAERSLLE